MKHSRRFINLPGRPANLPFSDAVLIDDTLYLSGCIGFDPKTGAVPGDVDVELKFLFQGFSAVLEAAKMNWDEFSKNLATALEAAPDQYLLVQVRCAELR